MSKSSKLHGPSIKKDVVRKLALGESQSQIGRELGVDRRTVGNWIRSREDIKKLVEEEQIRLMEKVPDAVTYVSSLIPEGGNGSGLEFKEKELAYKVSSDVLRAVGLMPSAAVSQVITNIYQEKAIINPIIMQLLEERDKKLLSLEGVVDVEREEK